MFARATTTRSMKRNAWRATLLALALASAAKAQTFSAAPVVFSPTGSNIGLAQPVSITLTAATTIRSITIPLPLAAQPEFFFVDNGGCVKDGTTVNAAGTVCSLTVRFHPAMAGLRTASLIITDGAGNATAIPISGVGYYPQISVIPSAMKIVAGLGPSQSGLHGDGDTAILASLSSPHGVAADSFGNIYIADTGNNVVRMLDAFGNITTVAGGGAVAKAAADGGLATAASLASPTWLAVDAAGNLYIAESGSHVVRRVSMSTSRTISTVAGSYARGFSGDGAVATSAKLDTPEGVVVDPSGNLYIADSGNYRVRRVDAATGNIGTFAGAGSAGFNAASTPAASAQFSTISALALDANGNLFVADTGNHAVREIAGGNVIVVAGTGASGATGDGSAATAAQLSAPEGLAISPAGDVYVSDAVSGTVRKVQASDGVIETVAGNAANVSAFTGGVRPSTRVQMNGPMGLAFDTASNLLVADSVNNVVRALVPTPAELTFSSQAAGTSSAPQTFRIENIGNAPLTLVSTATANSTTSSNFTLANGTTDACGPAVSSGAHCSYSITFAPAQNSAVSGEVDVTYQSNNPNFNSIAPVYLKAGAVDAFAITPSTLAPLQVNTSASVAITTTGSTGAVAFDLAGVLPPGMASAISNGTLTLSGTPTQTGSYSFTVFANDALSSAAQTYTLQVVAASVPLNITETIHVTDAPQTVLSVQLTVTESIHIADAPTALPSKSLVVTETIHVTDAFYALAPASLNVTEAVHVSDTPSVTPSVALAITETIHVTDAPKETLPVALAVTESIHVSDTPKETPSLALAITEAIHVTDAPSETRSVVLAITEAIHVSDTPKQSLPVALVITETVHVMDTPSVKPSIALAIVEAIHVADGDTNTPSSFSTTNEAVHVTDTVSLIVGPASQTITAPTVPAHTYGDAAFTVSASATSGLPVSFAVQSGPASVSGNMVSINGAGSVTLTLTQSGNATYSAAKPVNVMFNVAPATITVTANSATRAYATANPSFTFGVAGFVHGDTTASLSGSPALSTTATFNSAAGTYPISVAQGTLSSANYTFSFIPGTLTVTGGASQVISFLQLPNVPLSVGSITLTARASSGLKVTYAVSGPATLSGSRVTLSGAGTVSVTASQAGNATYTAAPSITRTFQVTP